MSDMVERVGAAIGAELVRQELAGEDFDEAGSNAALGRAAIMAMREPTEAMTFAGSHDNSGGVARRGDTENYNLVASGARINEHNVGVAWRRMIDAALTPTPTEKD